MNNKPLIYFVEDNPVFMEVFLDYLSRSREFEIQSFPTGEQCIEKLHHNPNVVILDYHLNNVDKKAMNGLEVLKKIKQYGSNIKVIMLSAQEDAKIVYHSIGEDAYDYVIKDTNSLKNILELIKQLLYKTDN